jgi:riboflavin kinase/FMN adenylyltransferase
MQIFRDLKDITDIETETAVTIGVFDGVHVGHQTIIKEAVALAKSINGKSVVITFHPHPLSVVRPDNAPPTLTAIDLKANYIRQLGVDYLLVVPFTEVFAKIEPEDFIDNVLAAKLHARFVIIGENFSFGKGRRGTTDFLTKRGNDKGFKTIVVPHIKKKDVIISSTEVRRRISLGDMAGARELIGRNPQFRGKVVHGFGRGSSLIGFPTANIETLYGEMLPKHGVYAGYTCIDEKCYSCVVDIGVSPTFGDVSQPEIQVHVIDFNRDIYGKNIDVELVSRIRGEKTFHSVEELKTQIALDVARTKELLAGESKLCRKNKVLAE